MLDKVSRFVNSTVYHVGIALAFLFVQVIGYFYLGGLSFVQGWGGGIAASIATVYLVFKSQGYWAWMIVNAGLWTYLFFHTGLPMLAWLQVSIMIFSVYGMIQWALVKYRIGFTPKVSSDLFGAILALGIFIYSVYAYAGMVGYAFTGYWWIEFFSVLTTVAAIWMDAFKYKTNWLFWTISNCFSFPLFLHLYLHDSTYAGPFWTIFLYQTINCVGFVQWYRDEKRLVREGKVELVGGAQYA
jgi:nicotinamide riboside transporter PnuC